MPSDDPRPNPWPIAFPYYPATVLNVAAGGLFLILAPLLYMLILRFHERAAYHVALPLTLVESVIVLLAAAVTIVLHEYIHGWGLRLHGYQVSYGVHWRKFMAYAAVFDQPMEREHVSRIALAPFVIITATMLPLLAFPNRYVIVVAFTALLINTAGSVGDLLLAWHLKYLPPRTLLCDIDLCDALPTVSGAAEARVETHTQYGRHWASCCEHYRPTPCQTEQPAEHKCDEWFIQQQSVR